VDAKETIKYLYEHGHIPSREHYKIISAKLDTCSGLLKTAKTLLIMLDNRHTEDDKECPVYREAVEYAEQAIAKAQS